MTISILCGLLSADEPRMLNEKELAAGADAAGFGTDVTPVLGGKALLCVRHQRASVPAKAGEGTETGSLYRLWMLDIASGTKHKLKLPASMGSEPLGLDDVLRLRVVAPDGRRAVLPGGVDANKDGILDHRREVREWEIYDLESGKHEPIKGLAGKRILPQFSRKGDRLVVASFSPPSLKLTLSLLNPTGTTRRALRNSGFPIALCPAADVAAVLRNMGEPPMEPYMKQGLALLDLTRDESQNLPTSDDYAQARAKRAVWTADGRYLYYTDTKRRQAGEPRTTPRRRAIARVWDTKTGKEVGLIERAVPIGPGPIPSTVVLGKVFDQQPYIPCQPVLHRADTGQLVTLCDVQPPPDPNAPLPMQPAAVHGKKLYFWRSRKWGERSLHVADIVVPREMSETDE